MTTVLHLPFDRPPLLTNQTIGARWQKLHGPKKLAEVFPEVLAELVKYEARPPGAGNSERSLTTPSDHAEEG